MAGYNNYFPQTYTYTPYNYSGQASTAPSYTQPAPAQNQANAINWVQGEAGARSVPVPPGQKVLLMDSETNVFYVKSSDISGMPLPLRIFEYKEVNKVATNAEVNSPQNTYVTHEELDERLKQLEMAKSKPKPKEDKPNEFLI